MTRSYHKEGEEDNISHHNFAMGKREFTRKLKRVDEEQEVVDIQLDHLCKRNLSYRSIYTDESLKTAFIYAMPHSVWMERSICEACGGIHLKRYCKLATKLGNNDLERRN